MHSWKRERKGSVEKTLRWYHILFPLSIQKKVKEAKMMKKKKCERRSWRRRKIEERKEKSFFSQVSTQECVKYSVVCGMDWIE